MKNALTFIMAGGKGERLIPLTRDRAKPAVPFGGIYRIIDFTLSNCINSGIRKIHVLTQYKSVSLVRHLWMGWNIFDAELGEYIDIIHPQQRVDEHWYQGTADSVYQNIYSIEMEKPAHILILAGDHIYKMSYAEMLAYPLEHQAEVTVGVIPMPREKAPFLGVVELDDKRRIVRFVEKPIDPPVIPEIPSQIYASMGIYLFNRQTLEEELTLDAKQPTEHDFGRNILPGCLRNGCRVLAFLLEGTPEQPPYWRDVGTLDAYYEANMDLVQVTPTFNLYDLDWPVRTHMEQHPPAKFVFAGGEDPKRVGVALDSMVAGGCILSGGKVARSILSPNVRINSFREVTDSILMEGVDIGRHCRIRRAIIDKDVKIPSSTVIGYEPQEDRRRFSVTESGITVVAKGTAL
jgi:glucose-1-phosphate adenylyltransferase